MTTRYEEQRTVPWQGVALPVLGGLGAAGVYSIVVRDLSPTAVTVGLAALLAVGLAIGSSPWGPLFKHVRVNDEGLDVGPWHLPASAIGRAWQVDTATARRRGARGTIEGLRLRRSSFGIFTTDDAAVVVEDTSADAPSGWLVATRHPDRLVAALAELRERTTP